MLEVINGITFLTPLWLRTPRLALVHHVHRDHYVAEMGAQGEARRLPARDGSAALPLPRLALPHDLGGLGARHRRARHPARADRRSGYIGVDAAAFEPDRAEADRRADAALPGPAQALQADRVPARRARGDARRGARHGRRGRPPPGARARDRRRALGDRVRMHGHVSEEAKRELLRRSWVNLTASSAEGWCLTVMEAASLGHTQRGTRGRWPAGVDRGRAHRGARARIPEELTKQIRRLASDREEVRAPRPRRARACARVHLGAHRARVTGGDRARRRRG